MRDRWTRHASLPFPTRFFSIISVRCAVLFAALIVLKNCRQIRAFVLPKRTKSLTLHKESRSSSQS